MTLMTVNCCFGWHVTAREERGTIVCAVYTCISSIYLARRLSAHEDDRRQIFHACAEGREANESDF
jgi:hypothetical protein